MSYDFGSFNMWGPLRKVALRAPDEAFVSESKIADEWQALNFHAAPDLAEARREYAAMLECLERAGSELIRFPAASGLTLDSLYTHDALIVTPKGLVLPNMGKPARRGEPKASAAHLAALGMPIAGAVAAPGKIEGGDLVWLDARTLLVGIGYRTDREGARQLQAICGSDVKILCFDMPHYKGRSDVFHLMSCLSPLDRDLAVVYPPLLAARLVEFLESRGMAFIEVPEAEFPTMGCNVLALGPRHAMMVQGNPETERRMKAAGVRVDVIKADEISRKGEGGPTCMTRPLVRG